jgi:hypothetical protein
MPVSNKKQIITKATHAWVAFVIIKPFINKTLKALHFIPVKYLRFRPVKMDTCNPLAVQMFLL